MKRTSGRPFWDEQLARKDTMIRAQAEEITKLRATIEAMRAMWKPPKGLSVHNLSVHNLASLNPKDLHRIIKDATGE